MNGARYRGFVPFFIGRMIELPVAFNFNGNVLRYCPDGDEKDQLD